jgi:hypothetical protein
MSWAPEIDTDYGAGLALSTASNYQPGSGLNKDFASQAPSFMDNVRRALTAPEKKKEQKTPSLALTPRAVQTQNARLAILRNQRG